MKSHLVITNLLETLAETPAGKKLLLRIETMETSTGSGCRSQFCCVENCSFKLLSVEETGVGRLSYDVGA